MKKEYGLTKTEMEIMEFLWSKIQKVPFKELLEYFTSELQKDWKKQTLSTYLINLQRTGLIGADMVGKNYYYFAALSKEELIHNWTRDLLKQSYGNSLRNFIAAFSGGEKLSKEEAEELKEFLD